MTARSLGDSRQATSPAVQDPAEVAGGASAHAPLEVVVLAPWGRDAALITSMLREAGIHSRVADSAEELLRVVETEAASDARPRVGAVCAADDALGIDWSLRLSDVLDRQPSWSDLPIVLLAQSPAAGANRGWVGSPDASPVAERLMLRGNVTVLDRPVRVATLVSAIRAALRARARQIEVCELLEARARAQKEAERLARAKSDFLAVMSHELRTPLNAIAGYAELLATGCHGPVTPEQQEVLGRITRAQRHLLGVINDVLNYARLEKGAVEYAIEAVNLRDIVAEVGVLIEPLITAKGLDYTEDLPSETVLVAADREKLRQILVNLLSNALKFTPTGGAIRVEVTTRANGTQPHDRVFLRVTDSGTGIPADKLEAIFEPFVQVRTNPAAMREGTGLGLAISRDLARGMGGDLRARSIVGKGSTFTLALRRAG